MIKSLIEYDIQLISSWKGVQVQEMNIQKDHIHLVYSIPPPKYLSVNLWEFLKVN